MLGAFPTFEILCVCVMKYLGRGLFVCLASALPVDRNSLSQQRWHAAGKKQQKVFSVVKCLFFPENSTSLKLFLLQKKNQLHFCPEIRFMKENCWNNKK